jgi:Sugar-specific transcriptional regulator TrmB.
MRKDVILAKARKNGLKERPVTILGYLLTAGNATVAECEEELKMNRRTLQSDLKLLVEKALAREVGTSPTDPTKYYQPLLCHGPNYLANIVRIITENYFRVYDLRSTYATRLSAGGVADEWVTQMLRQAMRKCSRNTPR